MNKRINCKSSIGPLRNPMRELSFCDIHNASLLNNSLLLLYRFAYQSTINVCVTSCSHRTMHKDHWQLEKQSISSRLDNIPVAVFYSKLENVLHLTKLMYVHQFCNWNVWLAKLRRMYQYPLKQWSFNQQTFAKFFRVTFWRRLGPNQQTFNTYQFTCLFRSLHFGIPRSQWS